jgi:hypothetical protein
MLAYRDGFAEDESSLSELPHNIEGRTKEQSTELKAGNGYCWTEILLSEWLLPSPFAFTFLLQVVHNQFSKIFNPFLMSFSPSSPYSGCAASCAVRAMPLSLGIKD